VHTHALFVPLWSKRKNWPNWIARHESKTPPKLRLIDSDKHDDGEQDR
jgi:hypothetical protein